MMVNFWCIDSLGLAALLEGQQERSYHLEVLLNAKCYIPSSMHNPTMLNLKACVTHVQRAQAVGNHQCRTANHQTRHRFHDGGLCSDIDGTGGLIEDENGGIFEERPCQ